MNTELCLAIIGSATGIIGAVLGVLGILHNRFTAVNQYLEGLEQKEFISARAKVHSRPSNQQIAIDDPDYPIVVNFFHHWGLLAIKHYLPMWVFDYGSGAGAIRYYELTQDYIMARRELHNDPTYAKGFELLYLKLIKKRTFCRKRKLEKAQ